jgi:hypothetical protein
MDLTTVVLNLTTISTILIILYNFYLVFIKTKMCLFIGPATEFGFFLSSSRHHMLELWTVSRFFHELHHSANIMDDIL